MEKSPDRPLNIEKADSPDEILALYPKIDEEKKVRIRGDIVEDFKKAGSGERIVYIAKIGDKVVGTIQLVFRGREYYSDGVSRAYIHHARVLEELRRMGVGTKLVEEAEKEAKARGFKEVTLIVEAENQKAFNFYKQIGYQEFKRDKDGNGVPIIGMIKKI